MDRGQLITQLLAGTILMVVSATYRKFAAVEKWRRQVDMRLARIEAKLDLSHGGE